MSEAQIAGYRVDEILYQGANSRLLGATRLADGARVVVKLPSGTASARETGQLRREHEILRLFDRPDIVRGHELVVGPGVVALVREGWFGVSLSQVLDEGPLDLTTFFVVARSIVDALAAVHAREVIHKDLKPSNILLDPATLAVKLNDFGLASRIPRTLEPAVSPETLEGTLAYCSPEQTGRVNRAVDYRTDFYALGATFYRMLTGRLPFTATDPLELVHAHLARMPAPPETLRPEIPPALSRMVLKLLAKSPEDRYRSAPGLLHDLVRCAEALRDGHADVDFEPGRNDAPARLTVPDRLYGRAAELTALLAAFDEVSAGALRLVLVTGEPGIGKSALIQEVHRPIVHKRGYFAAGKFDQFQRDIPFCAVILAFRDLLRHLLTESEDRVAAWRHAILEAVGATGRVVSDVIPEVELIIGPQPPLPGLDPRASQARFKNVFTRFARVFADPAHPLVLFLDDLQWADGATLDLIEMLVLDGGVRALLLICGYRDSEVGPTHPLLVTLDRIRDHGATPAVIRPDHLGLPAVAELIADTLAVSVAEVGPLAEICLAKTSGNPLFLRLLLRTIHEDGLLRHDPATGAWTWDPEAIRSSRLTDEVVGLVISRLGRISAEGRRLLQIASCIGNGFDAPTLARIAELPLDEVWARLGEAITQDFVIARSVGEGTALLFVHDRIQQAAYATIPEGERSALHCRVGRHLREGLEQGRRGEQIFAVVNQLQRGRSSLVSAAERAELGRLSEEAGSRAKASAAYRPAHEYFRQAIELLPEDAWEKDHARVHALHVTAAETAYLAVDLPRMEELAALAIARAREPHQSASMYALLMVYQSTVRNDNLRSLDIMHDALEALGERIPRRPGVPEMIAEVARTRLALGRRTPADLGRLPDLTDPRQAAIMRIINTGGSAAYYSNPQLLTVILLRGVALSARHGICAEAAFCYAGYGLVLAGVLGDVEGGYAFGKLALQVIARYGAHHQSSANAFMFYSFIAHHKIHLADTLPGFLETYRSGLESGDKGYALGGMLFHAIHALACGRELGRLSEQMDEYGEVMRRLSQTRSLNLQLLLRQVAADLVDGPGPAGPLEGRFYLGEENLARAAAASDRSTPFWVRVHRAVIRYAFGDAAGAHQDIEAASVHVKAAPGQALVPIYHFYRCLTLLARCRTAGLLERARLLLQVEVSRRKLVRCAEHAPMNHQHKVELVEAELARVRGDSDGATRRYEQAAALAAESGFVNEEALALERAGLFHLEAGRARLARHYLESAAGAYLRWGARAKVADLQRRHAGILVVPAPAPAPTAEEEAASEVERSISREESKSYTAQVLDLAAILGASRAISEELVFDNLLRKLIELLIQNAGAERGLLLVVEEDGRLVVAAESGGGVTRTDPSEPGEPGAPTSILNYVVRTRESVVLDDAASEGRFLTDPYVAERRPRSVLATPLVNQGKLIAVVYLENNLVPGAFTPERIEILRHLSAQAALSLYNAQLFARLEESNRTLEHKVEERTGELRETNTQLREAQQQLVVQEKLASLGALTAGIAHEIKNPLNFINNFAELTTDLADELTVIWGAQRGRFDAGAAADVTEIVESVRHNVVRINEHGRRANGIIDGMLLHARASHGTREPTDLNALVAESVQLAHQGIRGKDAAVHVDVRAEYDPRAGLLDLVHADLSRVFVNVLNNACYAVWQKQRTLGAAHAPAIVVTTHDRGGSVEVRIRDNGAGIPASVADKIFNPFFTTKPPGEGTGLGLSIGHDIVVQGHQGQIRFESEPGEFTEFIITLPRRAGAAG